MWLQRQRQGSVNSQLRCRSILVRLTDHRQMCHLPRLEQGACRSVLGGLRTTLRSRLKGARRLLEKPRLPLVLPHRNRQPVQRRRLHSRRAWRRLPQRRRRSERLHGDASSPSMLEPKELSVGSRRRNKRSASAKSASGAHGYRQFVCYGPDVVVATSVLLIEFICSDYVCLCIEKVFLVCFWSHYPLAKVGYTSKSKRTNYKTKTQTKLSACLVQVLSAGWCIPRTPRARQQPQAQWHRRWRPTTSPRKSQPRTVSRGRARRHRRTRCR